MNVSEAKEVQAPDDGERRDQHAEDEDDPLGTSSPPLSSSGVLSSSRSGSRPFSIRRSENCAPVNSVALIALAVENSADGEMTK